MAKKALQVAILGLGIFGSTLSETLAENGVEVLAVDIDPVCVERVSDEVTRAVVADITDKEQLLELGITEFDVVIVSLSKHFEESVLCTMILKELGVTDIIAKARTRRKGLILEKVGATRVVNSEKDMAHRIAKSLLRHDILDLINLDEEHSVAEIKAPAAWIGKTIDKLNIRSAYDMNIIGIYHGSDENMYLNFNADYVVVENDRFLVIGNTRSIEKWDRVK